LNDGERRDFVELFTQLLRDGFANRFFEYSDEQVEYLDERSEGNSTELRTRLRGSKVDIPILYRMMNTARGWLVYDVVIDGVDFVHNYRAQFSAILHTSSYAALVETLRQKALAQKAFEKNLTP